MRPVLAGMMRMESLIDRSLDLEHVAWANEALSVQADNERRYREEMEERSRR